MSYKGTKKVTRANAKKATEKVRVDYPNCNYSFANYLCYS